MYSENSTELWRQRIFRDVARFIHRPDASTRARVMWLIDSYMYFHHHAAGAPAGDARDAAASLCS